jgi:hypothetical protein
MRSAFARLLAPLTLALMSRMVSGCAHGTLTERIYQDRETTYRLGWLPASWKQFRLQDGDVGYKHREGGTIYADHFCRASDDVPLDVLTNHLLFDVRAVHELSREKLTIDGRAALRTQVEGEMDGVPITLDLVVLKKDGCTYDMVLISGRNSFAERVPDFDVFVHGFTTVS